MAQGRLNRFSSGITVGRSGGTLVAQQPLLNIVRVTIEALSAVLGGSQSLRTSSYDEAYAIPTEEAEMLAIRTQQVACL